MTARSRSMVAIWLTSSGGGGRQRVPRQGPRRFKGGQGSQGTESRARLMLTRVVSATLPRTSCWARVVRLIPEILQTSAVLAVGATP